MKRRWLITASVVSFGLAHFTHLRAAHRERRAETDYPAIGHVVEIDGHHIHVVETGQLAGQAPDLVLIHGSNGNFRDHALHLAPALADRYRILIVDRPGLGHSAPLHQDGASLSEQAHILQRAARELGANHPIVLGQSYGGAVALAWACNHPSTLSALVTVSSVTHPWDTGIIWFYKVTSSFLGSKLLIPLITAFVPVSKVERDLTAVFAPNPVPDGYAQAFGLELSMRRSSLRANAQQRANLLRHIRRQVPKYTDLTLPVEVLHGDQDQTVSIDIHARALVRDVGTAVLTVLHGHGHMPHHSATTEVAAAVDRAAQRAALR